MNPKFVWGGGSAGKFSRIEKWKLGIGREYITLHNYISFSPQYFFFIFPDTVIPDQGLNLVLSK